MIWNLFFFFFWHCIHYDGPTAGRVVPKFEKWNYVDMEELAELKKGAVAHEGNFISMVNEYFTGFYKPSFLGESFAKGGRNRVQSYIRG